MQFKKKSYRFAVGIVLLALVARVGFILLCGREEKRYDALYDDLIYTDLAHQLISGQGYSLSHEHFVASPGQPTLIVEPGYPLLLAMSYLVFGECALPIRLLQAAIGAVTCALVYAIGREAISEVVGRVAASISAVYPLFIMYTRPLLTETVFCFALAGCVWCVYRLLERPTAWRFLLGGVLVGVGALVRGDILVYGLLFVVYLCSVLWQRVDHRVLLANVALLSLASVLVLSPWVVRNWQVHGVMTPFPNKRWAVWRVNCLRYLRENSPEWRALGMDWQEAALPEWDVLTETERDRRLAAINSEFIMEHPMVFVRYALTRVMTSYPVVPRELLPPPMGYKGVRERPADNLPNDALDEFPLYYRPPAVGRVWAFRLIFLLSLAGTADLVRRRQLGPVAPLILAICGNIILAALVNARERYRLSIEPYLIIIAASSITHIWRAGHKAILSAKPHSRQETVGDSTPGER